MSKQTARMGYPYPSRDQDPWYDDFEALAIQMDGGVFGAWEHANGLWRIDGEIRWAGSTFEITKSIWLTSPTSLQHVEIVGSDAGGGEGIFTLAASQALVATVPRGTPNGARLTKAASQLTVVNSITPSFGKVVLAARIGNNVVLWNGGILLDGERAVQRRPLHRVRLSVETPATPATKERYDWMSFKGRLVGVELFCRNRLVSANAVMVAFGLGGVAQIVPVDATTMMDLTVLTCTLTNDSKVFAKGAYIGCSLVSTANVTAGSALVDVAALFEEM